MQKKPLYFIALIPPEPFRDDVWKMKEYFRDHYKSKASLNSPPHITLCPPFSLSISKNDLLNKLREVGNCYQPFEVTLENYGAFPPRVIYIDVMPDPTLNRLQKDLKSLVQQMEGREYADEESKPFHPHITLAFRDLDKLQFSRAWNDFNERELSYGWLVESFVLLRHNGKRWEEWRQFSLGV